MITGTLSPGAIGGIVTGVIIAITLLTCALRVCARRRAMKLALYGGDPYAGGEYRQITTLGPS